MNYRGKSKKTREQVVGCWKNLSRSFWCTDMKYILKTKLIEPDDRLTMGNEREREKKRIPSLIWSQSNWMKVVPSSEKG